MLQLLTDEHQTLASNFLDRLNQHFSTSPLAHYIDFYSLGWVLFFMTFLIYIVSKEQWLRLKTELQQLVMLDPLTRLPNRRLFADRAAQMLKIAHRQEKGFAVILGDLDYFKLVNDSLGHHAGDLLLKELAVRFTEAIRGEDTVARLGGDEFAFLIHGVQSEKEIAMVITRIYNSLEAPIAIEDRTFNIGISLGVAFYPCHCLEIEGLLRRADIALYRAKDKRNTYEIYLSEDEEALGLTNIARHNDLRKVG
jgi:diguanylate cyclase (GGDEF)-like protein